MATARRPPRSSALAAPARRRVRLFVVLLLAGLGVGLAPGCRSGGDDDEAAIRSLIGREVEALNTKNLQELSEIWSQRPEILLFDVPPPGRFQGWERIARVFMEFFERFEETHLVLDAIRVDVRGSLAYATYDWTLTGRMGEQAVSDRGQATAIYEKEKGGWRLVHAHYSPVPAAVALGAGTPADAPEPAPVPAGAAAAGAPPGAP